MAGDMAAVGDGSGDTDGGADDWIDCPEPWQKQKTTGVPIQKPQGEQTAGASLQNSQWEQTTGVVLQNPQ